MKVSFAALKAATKRRFDGPGSAPGCARDQRPLDPVFDAAANHARKVAPTSEKTRFHALAGNAGHLDRPASGFSGITASSRMPRLAVCERWFGRSESGTDLGKNAVIC